MVSCWSWLRHYVSVEPAVFLATLGATLVMTLIPTAYQAKYWWIYLDELTKMTVEEQEIFLQQKQTYWSILESTVAKPIAILATLLLGALSDRIGRKPLILLSIATGAVMSQMQSAFLHPLLNLGPWFLLVQSFVFNAFGGAGATELNNAYLVDKNPDPKALSLRMSIIMVITMATVAVSNNLSGLLVTMGVDLPWLFVISTFILVLAFIYCLLFVDDIEPRHAPEKLEGETQHQFESRVRKQSEQVRKESRVKALRYQQEQLLPPSQRPKANVLAAICSSVKEVVSLEWQAIKVAFKPRRGRKRMFLLCTMVVSALSGVAEKQEERLMSLYTLQAPFRWTHNEFRTYTNIKLVSLMIGTLAGMLIMKKVLRLRDTTIMLIGLAVNALDVLITACSTQTLHIYIGTFLCEGPVVALVPASMAFVALLVPPDEVGKVYAIFVVLEQINSVFQLVVLQPIYLFTVGIFKQTIWIILCLINIFSFFIMLWIHVASVRDNIEDEKEAELDAVLVAEQEENAEVEEDPDVDVIPMSSKTGL